MTPREYEFVVAGLREFRAEEQRLARDAMAQSTGKKVVGGEVIHND